MISAGVFLGSIIGMGTFGWGPVTNEGDPKGGGLARAGMGRIELGLKLDLG